VTRIRSLLLFVFHQVVGTWGIAFLAAFGLFELFDVLTAISPWKPSIRMVHWVLTEDPFYPVQILAGLYFGWLLGRRFQHKCMPWIWIVPSAILAYAIVTTNLNSSVLFHHIRFKRASLFTLGGAVSRGHVVSPNCSLLCRFMRPWPILSGRW
jgi:hypothetical protein